MDGSLSKRIVRTVESTGKLHFVQTDFAKQMSRPVRMLYTDCLSVSAVVAVTNWASVALACTNSRLSVFWFVSCLCHLCDSLNITPAFDSV